MKTTKTTAIFFVFCCAALFLTSCSGGNNGDPNRGFDILIYAQAQGGGMIVPTAGNVQGQFLNGAGTYGTVPSFNQNFSGVGLLNVAGAKVPGTWQLTLSPGIALGSLCLTGSTVNKTVSRGSQESLICPGRYFSFPAAPGAIDVSNSPATMTFNGQGIVNTYGTPVTAFYNEFGSMIASTPAVQYLTDNNGITGISVNVPSNLSGMADGNYPVIIYNVASDGSLDVVGASQITIYGNSPPPPPPGGGGGGCEPGPKGMEQLPCEEQ